MRLLAALADCNMLDSLISMYGSCYSIVNDSGRSLCNAARTFTGDFLSSTKNVQEVCSALSQVLSLLSVLVIPQSDPKGSMRDLSISDSVVLMYASSD